MAEYIEREAAINCCFAIATIIKCGISESDAKRILEAFNEIPAVDVRPVVRGKWEYTVIEGDVISEIPTVVKGVCSVCHNYSEEMPKWIYDDGGRIWFNYCPNCGADMRAES